MISRAHSQFLLLVVLFNYGCQSRAGDEKAFVDLSYEDQIHVILSSGPDKQLDLFFVAYRMVPPNDGAKSVLADLGGAIITEVLARLREADSEDTRDLVDLLVEMQIQGSYCVSCDHELMDAINESIQRISNDRLRSRYFKKVSEFLR